MTGYRWIVLGAGCAGTMVVGAVYNGMLALAPRLRDEFALSVSELGVVFAALGLALTAGLLPWGALADRIGERRVLAIGLGGCAAAMAFAGLAATAAGFLLAACVAMFFSGSATGASGRAIMGWFGSGERGLALGIRQTMVPAGGALAALTLPAVAAAGGLDAALYALAGFAFCAAAAGALLVREPAAKPVAGGGPAPASPAREPRIWRLSIGSGLMMAGQAGTVSYAVLFLVDEHDQPAGRAALVLAAIHVAAAVMRILVGRWSDRAARRIAPVRAAGACGAALIALTGLLADAPTPVVVLALVAAGATMSSWNGLAFTAAAELAGPSRAGTAMGFQNTAVAISSAAATPLFGVLVQAGSWRLAYLSITVAPLAGWWVLRPLDHA